MRQKKGKTYSFRVQQNNRVIERQRMRVIDRNIENSNKRNNRKMEIQKRQTDRHLIAQKKIMFQNGDHFPSKKILENK